jgi:hypothetical protein
VEGTDDESRGGEEAVVVSLQEARRDGGKNDFASHIAMTWLYAWKASVKWGTYKL